MDQRKENILASMYSPARPSRRWAWAVSIALHLCLFGVFAAINLHDANGQSERVGVSKANIKAIQENSLTVPKPNIKPPSTTAAKQALRPDAAEKPAFLRSPQEDRPEPAVQTLATPAIAQPRTEFFGSRTSQRKICYVVDCSGSMLGFFSRVRDQLAASINSLKPDQYFYVIFFHGDELIESGDGRFKRASRSAKAEAIDFVRSIRPGGATNAERALRRAMLIRDHSGNPAQQIYFLTDGFDFASPDPDVVSTFTRDILEKVRLLAPRVRISTIGFWVEPADEEVLRSLARLTQGDFVNLGEE
ncbi:marine proteobacterial sortase target protein [Anaerohalosphaera lusitana]|uniref:Marine proteobacterial sortase target protein n=1 Tax=Anaerohalosphaera lusitana TaxID=1936003 RepID=A0A1U9NKJ1_9BACT|nr:VWA domain-containing protein [Anaerohalosphaera lusitana]AQT68419.1 marine proteobacterial sortase target protein [Anaerohalosphaera lusitana]